MAEAHSAVAFSFAITHEGWDVNFDREVLGLVWDSGVRSWKKRIARFKNNLKTGFFPVPVSSLFATVAVVSGCHFNGVKVPGLEQLLILLPKRTLKYEILACAGLGTLGCFGVSLSMKYALKFLFLYKGWMYEERGAGKKITLKTKAWLCCVRLLTAPSKPMLYSYQGSLPRLPLPSLKDTMQRYLRSVRPLLDDTQYTRMEGLARDFQKGIGVKLQRYLILKSWWATNYVSDWWEEYVYLRGRSPLMINSNFYGMDALFLQNTSHQSARAAVIIYAILQFRRLIERQQLEPILLQGVVPLCSWQYERLFNTTRVPGPESDKLVHLTDSKHIVVYHKGRYFKVLIYHNRRILEPCEIEMQIQSILNDESQPCEGEERLAALTAGERTHWAHNRLEHFFRGTNRQSLDTIEKAAFFVTLDDVPYEFDPAIPSKLDEYGAILLHGKGYDRWFDKSFTLCVGSNGRIGFNAEHSWADAPIMSQLVEHIVISEIEIGYKEDGHTKGTAGFVPPPPTRLQWDLKPSCINAIDSAYLVAKKLIDDVDLKIYMHSAYGKGFMKLCRLSPDAYLQMVLQLAYYRNAGKFSLTYEASMTRLYREGRTETVRPCTIESAAWVKSMSDNTKTVAEKVSLLQKACLQHQKGYQDAMSGKGIDRHLFCLYVVSKYLEVDSPFLKDVIHTNPFIMTSSVWFMSIGRTERSSPTETVPQSTLAKMVVVVIWEWFVKGFSTGVLCKVSHMTAGLLKEVLSEPWRLSTSQTPHGQTPRFNLKKYPGAISAGGGFGPVADDGYGVSYIVAGEDMVFFHISSKKSCPTTDSGKFAQDIEKAMADVKTLFMEYQKEKEAKK